MNNNDDLADIDDDHADYDDDGDDDGDDDNLSCLYTETHCQA